MLSTPPSPLICSPPQDYSLAKGVWVNIVVVSHDIHSPPPLTHRHIVMGEEEHVSLRVIVEDGATLHDDALILQRVHQRGPVLKHTIETKP